MSQNVVGVVALKAQDFPVGTVDTRFVFTIEDSAGVVIVSQSVDVPTATFSAVIDGSYIMKVEKNGVVVSQTFNVVTPVVALQVPETVTVSFT